MGSEGWLDHPVRDNANSDKVFACLIVAVVLYALSAINSAYVTWRIEHQITARFDSASFLHIMHLGTPLIICAIIVIAWATHFLSIRRPWFLLWLCFVAWVLLRLAATQGAAFGELPGAPTSEGFSSLVAVKLIVYLLPITLAAILQLWHPIALWLSIPISLCFSLSTSLQSTALEKFGITLVHAPLSESSLLIVWKALDLLAYELNIASICLIAYYLVAKMKLARLALGVLISLVLASLYCYAFLAIVSNQFNMQRLGEMLTRDWCYIMLMSIGLYFVFGRQSFESARDELAKKLESVDKSLSEAQLQILQAQLEPHFLFNTLANVKRLYQTAPESGKAMLSSLLAYLAVALPKLRNSAATLGEELTLVTAYLAILKQRMGERLLINIQAPEALQKLPFPAMMILTLVENAIAHGLMPLIQGGELNINISMHQKALHVSVSDTGIGFNMTSSSGTGVGLANLRERLRALYGSQARLDLLPVNPQGLMALIVMPVSD